MKLKHIILRKEINIVYWNSLKVNLQKKSPYKHITDEMIVEELKRQIQNNKKNIGGVKNEGRKDN